MSKRTSAIALLGLLVSIVATAGETATPVPNTADNEVRDWAPIALRGYGTLSGKLTQRRLPAGPASILTIHCENADKAKIVHAKYLSDLGLLPGVRKVDAASVSEVPHWEISGNSNVFSAAQSQNDVLIFQAAAATDLQALIQVKAGTGTLAFSPQGEVPMFLDRWDRFGFRFYYGPWSTPSGVREQKYDFKQDFDFAVKSDRAGLVIWDHVRDTDTSAGIMNVTNWKWAMDEARTRKLPVAINDSIASPHWLTNAYRGETMMKAPGYLGGLAEIAKSASAGTGNLSWGSVNGRNALLSTIQGTVRSFNAYPNLVSWLEPDGEVPLTPQCLLTDYGPTADASYTQYLQKTYKSVKKVSQRWYGDSQRLKSWKKIHVPEVAYFRGGGPGCVDLAGNWKIAYEPFASDKAYTPKELIAFRHKPVPTESAPTDWFKADFDDSSWPEITAPGDDKAMLLQKRPAVFRRNFNLDPAVKQKHDHWWLYVWDLNRVKDQKMWACVNGKKVGESQTTGGWPAHWAGFEVTANLQAGKNQITLRLPEGFLGYRVYLSSQPPRDYPNLGEGMNAEWVDYINWTYGTHVDVIRRGVEMIRQVDPNRQITIMHPDELGDGVKEIAEDFGAEFHCTGYMSGFFAEMEPMVMRGSDLPSSLEPGGPAHTLEEFKGQMGFNISEGVQGIDYFMHMGDVMWHDDIRAYFEDHREMLHMVGKYHAPKAEAAMLIDNRNMALTGWPWGDDPNVLMGSGYWFWNVTAGLLELFHTDGVMEYDFARGNAAKYKIIVDSNTTIMDEELVNQIERYVRDGGIFITFVQTGRHTPTKLNAWPIERLTGYRVTHIDASVKNAIPEFHPIKPAPNQDVFSRDDWSAEVKPNGLTLEKIAPDCQDLMLWENGKTAVGLRPLGRGYIVEVGVKFAATQIGDRWGAGQPRPTDLMMNKLFIQLFDHFKVKRMPATLSEPFSDIMWRHYVSNNGLYDVWSLSNRSKTEAHTVGLTFEKGLNPAQCFEIKNEAVSIPVTHKDGLSAIENLAFEAYETRIFITPREHAEQASVDWFELQRNWWRGTTPIRQKVPQVASGFTINLSDDWAFQPIDDKSDAAAMSAIGYDDSKWERRALGAWGLSDHPEVKHALLRKTFTVPGSWSKGQNLLWMMCWGTLLEDSGRFFLDGKEVKFRTGVGDFDGWGTLKPGTSHVAAIEVKGTGTLVGTRAPVWLSYLPDPQLSIDLSGQWQQSDDYFSYNKTVSFPGHWDGVAAKKTFRIDSKNSGRNIFVDFDGPMATSGLLINGVYLNHAANWAQGRWQINITPWVRFGKENELQILGTPIPARDNSKVSAVKIVVYDPAVYP